MSQEERARVNIVITGLVQGVFFRASTLEKAQSLSLSGWVKNQPDGSVEIMAEGERYALEELVLWCRQGPPGADIKDVFSRFDTFKDEFRTFTILR